MSDQPAAKGPAPETALETKPEEPTKAVADATAPPAAEAGTSAPAAIDPPTVTHWSEPGYGDDLDDDGDSAIGDDNASSTASVSASILEYRTINGRRYHAERGEAEYWGPNDERQNESMDITHHVMTMTLGDKLYLAPLGDKIGKVLDLATGTGIWAVDFGDEHPEAQVIGTDISPTQTTWVPPNVKFEVDDMTLPWTFQPDTFDFIHTRLLLGSVADYTALYKQAYTALKPGAWVESHEVSVGIFSDDGTVAPGMALYEWGSLFKEVGKKMGRELELVDQPIIEDAIRAAGFVDIEVKRIKQPFTGFPQDERLRKIGMYNHVATEQGLEGYALFMLTHIMGWAPEQVQLLLSRVRKELRSKKVHPWHTLAVVYGRKPLAA